MPNTKQSIYSDNPMHHFPKQAAVIPESAKNLLMAQIRYYRDLSEALDHQVIRIANIEKARGVAIAYALLTGCDVNEVMRQYNESEFGGAAELPISFDKPL